METAAITDESRILLIDDNTESRESVREECNRLGHALLEAGDCISGYRLARTEHPDMVVLNMQCGDGHAERFCVSLRKNEITREIPILALGQRSTLKETERIFDLGANAFVPMPMRAERFTRTIEDVLKGMDEDELSAPPELRALFENERPDMGQLGNMAEIHAGASLRKPEFRRRARPGPEWAGFITDETIRPFAVLPNESWVLFDRRALIRLPHRDEYDHAEKVVVCRSAPPVVAGVDRSRSPYIAGVLGIVPARDLLCGYLTCLLNSRLMDFFFNRVRRITERPGGSYLRAGDLEAMPVVVPPLKLQKELAFLADNLAGYFSQPLPQRNPRQRPMLAQMNQAIFDLYGLDETLVSRLSELHF